MEPRIDIARNELGARLSKRFGAVGMLLHGATLPPTVRALVELRVSQINGCGWCVDAHAKEAAAAGESAVRLSLVAVWRESTVFSGAERAALALAEEGTRLADAAEGVSDATWEQARAYYDEDQLVALIATVAMVNAANRLAVIARQRGGSYEPGMFEAAAS